VESTSRHSESARCKDDAVADDRRVTVRDVARLASVSPSAASSALRGDGRLHPETRARILAAASELGYRRNAVARALRKSANGVVATVLYGMPRGESLRRPKSLWEQALFGYVQELANAGIGNVFVPSTQSHMLEDLPADVVVFFNLPQGSADPCVEAPHNVPTIRVVSATDIPVATKARHEAGTETRAVGRVVWDYHAALGAALTHLDDGGSQSPGLLLPPKPLMPAALIRQAHADWCLANKRQVLLAESPDDTVGTRELLDRGCDGFVIHGDDAVGDVEQVLAAIESAGLRVPQDVLVASISDGKRESQLQPPVTSLSYDGMASGVAIARAVIDGLQTGDYRDTTIEWDLEARASSLR